MKRTYIFLMLFIIAIWIVPAKGQNQNSYIGNPVTLDSFLEKVRKGNLGYIAQQLNVSIAEAELAASKVFPDPEISVSYTDNDDKKLKMGQTVETGLSYPVNLGNKRGAGVALSKSQFELSGILLEAYFQNLRADAARTYYTSLLAQKLSNLEKETYDQLHRLASADSIKLAAGEGSKLDAMQSMVEARSQLSLVYQSTTELLNSQIGMLKIQGIKVRDTLDYPAEDFPGQVPDFYLADLTSNALKNRADLLAAIKNREVSANNLRLIKAERAPDINLQTGYSYNTASYNNIAPAPKYNAITAGIGIPIKFSSINSGSVRAARLAVQQSETAGKETEIEIISEVYRAYNNFSAQKRKLELYNSGIVSDAQKILEGRIYSYQRGESGLVEVLTAQRSYIELEKNYIQAKYDYTSALIDLELSAAIWDIK